MKTDFHCMGSTSACTFQSFNTLIEATEGIKAVTLLTSLSMQLIGMRLQHEACNDLSHKTCSPPLHTSR